MYFQCLGLYIPILTKNGSPIKELNIENPRACYDRANLGFNLQEEHYSNR